MGEIQRYSDQQSRDSSPISNALPIKYDVVIVCIVSHLMFDNFTCVLCTVIVQAH